MSGIVGDGSGTDLGNVKHEKKHRLKQRFEVRGKLGQGTYGKVQLAINKETGQEVSGSIKGSPASCPIKCQ